MNHFSELDTVPSDPILGLNDAFAKDRRSSKVNLGMGVYVDETGRVPLLHCVQSAEQMLMSIPRSRSYVPMDGLEEYRNGVKHLLLQDMPSEFENAICVQALGGTGALRLGAELIRLVRPAALVAISDPSWENHRAIFETSGFNVTEYPYYNRDTKQLDFDGMIRSLDALPPGSVVVLHACCHNPTGCDLSAEQWTEVSTVLQRRQLLPFLDMAYQVSVKT